MVNKLLLDSDNAFNPQLPAYRPISGRRIILCIKTGASLSQASSD